MAIKYFVPPKEFFIKGTADENFIMEATEKSFGGRCYRDEDEKTRYLHDKYDHIDFWWDSPKGGTFGVDAKGLKKNKRTDKTFDDSIQWIEIQGNSGYPGWIYGKAKYIAFRTNSSIIYVRREKLANYAEGMVQGKELVFETPMDFYIPYQRKKYGKKDISIKVPTSDILELSDFVLDLTI